MTIEIKTHFNRMTKDSKKEALEFLVTGEDERRRELFDLTRSVVILQIESEPTELTAELKSATKGSKNTKLAFIIKGDTSADQAFEFYKFTGKDLTLIIKPSQMSLEDFKAPHEGVTGKINADGTATVDPNQAELDVE